MRIREKRKRERERERERKTVRERVREKEEGSAVTAVGRGQTFSGLCQIQLGLMLDA
jgi:hypothetical protein